MERTNSDRAGEKRERERKSSKKCGNYSFYQFYIANFPQIHLT